MLFGLCLLLACKGHRLFSQEFYVNDVDFKDFGNFCWSCHGNFVSSGFYAGGLIGCDILDGEKSWAEGLKP